MSEHEDLLRRLAGWEHTLANEESDMVIEAAAAIRKLEAERDEWMRAHDHMTGRLRAEEGLHSDTKMEVERLTHQRDTHYVAKPFVNTLEKQLVDADEALRELRSEATQLHRALVDVCVAIGTDDYLDPPDGGTTELAEQVRRMRAELQALREATSWRPIESAPRDGTAIMLANKHGVWVGHYVERYVSGYVPADKWHTLMLNHRHIPQPAQDKSYRPTHWQPLPAPPTREGG